VTAPRLGYGARLAVEWTVRLGVAVIVPVSRAWHWLQMEMLWRLW
jgi:hypothetical protein